MEAWGQLTAFSPVFNACEIEASGLACRRAELYGHFVGPPGCADTLGQSSTSCPLAKEWLVLAYIFDRNPDLEFIGTQGSHCAPIIHGSHNYNPFHVFGHLYHTAIDCCNLRITSSQLPQPRSWVCLWTGCSTPVKIKSITSSTGLSCIARTRYTAVA